MESQEIKKRIIDILSREKSHPTASAILEKARRKAPSISLSTVYYTLDIMKRAGLIKELEFADRAKETGQGAYEK